MNFKNFIKSFLVISILLICQPAYAITVNASRVTGVAPLSVHFYDSDVVASTPTSRLFHDREYSWGFDDSSAGNWGTNGISKNIAKGAVAAHVFETPGNYTVTLTVRDETGIIGSDTEIITVTDPDTVYAGALTTCVSDTAHNDFTGAPAGATQVCTDDLSTITGYAGAGERLLFHRGSSWTNTGIEFPNNTGPVTIGAYGTGTTPDALGIYSNAPHITNSGVFCDLSYKRDWRFSDLHFSGENQATGPFWGAMDMRTILLHRIKTVGLVHGFAYTFWKNAASNLIDCIAVVSCDFGTGYNMRLYIGSERLAVLGNILVDSTATHVSRIYQAYRGVISHNRFSGSSTETTSGRHALKLHGPAESEIDPNGTGTMMDNPTQFAIVSNNVFGSSGPWPVSIGPQDQFCDERVSDVIFEKNRVVSDYGTGSPMGVQVGLGIEARYVTARNNILDGTGSLDYYTGVYVWQRGLEPSPLGVRVYNNTINRSDGTGTSGEHVGVHVTDACNDTIVRNNLISFPNWIGYMVMINDLSTDGISSNNLMTDTPGFTDSGNADPLLRDFSLLETSPAINQGTTVSFLDDYTGAYRDSGVYDIGAFEYSDPAICNCPDPMPSWMVMCEDWEEDSPPANFPNSGGTVWPDPDGVEGTSNYGWVQDTTGDFSGSYLTTTTVFAGNRALNKTKNLGEKGSGQIQYYVPDGHDHVYMSAWVYFPETTDDWSHNHFIRMNAESIAHVGLCWWMDEIHPVAMAQASLWFSSDPGTFTIDETVTGGTSGATAIVIDQDSFGATHRIWLAQVTGEFTDTEVITGGTSGISQATTNYYTGGERRARNAFDISQHWNEWIHIEWMVNFTNNSTSLWFNGVNYVDNHRMSYPDTEIDRLNIVHYSNVDTVVQTFIIDNVVLSDQYVGNDYFTPGGSTPPPPISRGRNIFYGIFNRVFGGF